MALLIPRPVQYVDQESDRSTGWPAGTIVYAIAERSITILKDGSFQNFSNAGGGSGLTHPQVLARQLGS
jgi:hypothetical protein